MPTAYGTRSAARTSAVRRPLPTAPYQQSGLPFSLSKLSFPATMTLGASPTPPRWQSAADRLHAARPAASKRGDCEENRLAK